MIQMPTAANENKKHGNHYVNQESLWS